MKLYCTDNKQTYDVEIQQTRLENPFVCPACRDDRKKKNQKSASFNSQKQVGKCSHCGFSFVVYKQMEAKREYKRPQETNRTELSDKLVSYFKSRSISQETLKALKVTEQKEWMPQTEKDENCICFNYYRNGVLINTKYRDGAKHFKLFSGAELIPFNLDGIRNIDTCVWVEGEFDALSYYDAGVTNVVSVPNGATLGNQNLTYIDNCIDEIEHITTHILAGDNDEAGLILRNELIRRFGAENCKTVDFNDCKDANEYLIKYGYAALKQTIDEAIDVPLSGIFNIEKSMDGIISLWENGMEGGKLVGHDNLDRLITWVSGSVAFWTGIPSHGKSEWVDEIVMQLNVRYGWKAAYFTPENRPTPIFISKLVSRLTGKKFDKHHTKRYEVEQSCGYINDNFFIIEPEEDITIENILSFAKLLVKRKGIKQLVIDPWNKIDHQMERGESETQYISRTIDKIYSFAQINDVLVHVVAHPVKMRKDANTGLYEVPTLYDISGSAHFYNKAFYGLSIYRRGYVSEVHVQKVKFKHLGNTSGGTAEFRYNINNGRFAPIVDSMEVSWDNEPYLEYEKPANYVEPFYNEGCEKQSEVPF